MTITTTGSNPTTVEATSNTTTTTSTRQEFINDSIVGLVDSGVTVDGFGLEFLSFQAGATISVTNNGTVTTNQTTDPTIRALQIVPGASGNFGTFTYSGSGNVTNTGVGGGLLVDSQGTGNVDITISGTSTISGATNADGLEASTGTGTVKVTVQSGGMVEGASAVALGGGVDTLDNSGTVQGMGTLSNGVSGQVATVINSGTISGTAEAVFVNNVTLTNNSGGMIETTGTTSGEAAQAAIVAVEAVTAADITNKSGATIQATGPLGQIGIFVTGTTTVDNAGTISAPEDGINTNTTAATTITNSGKVTATGSASVTARSGIRANTATVENDQGGTISGLNGIFFRDPAQNSPAFSASSVFNDGTITGTGATAGFGTTPIAIHFSAGSIGNTLTLGTDSVINGNVLGAGSDIFQLGGTGSATFDVSNIGAAAQYRGFSTFNKIDTSTWTLTGTDTDGWTVEQGTLQVDGTIGSTTVQSGGTLDGTGTTGALTVDKGGTLTPGDDPGTITTGNLDLQSGSAMSIGIEGASPGAGGFGQVVVNGSVTLAGTLSATLLNGFTPQGGEKFEIINNDGNDPVSGNFAGLSEGASFTLGGTTFSISYVGGTGNDVVLTASDIAPQTDLNGSGPGNNNTATLTKHTVAIAPAATVTDADNANLASLTATLTTRPDGNAVESLALDTTAAALANSDGLSVTYAASTGVLSVTGSASTADYQSILQGVVYENTSNTPNTSDRNVNVVVNDGTDSSVSHSVTISIAAVQQNGAISYDLNGDAISDLVFQNNGQPGIWLWNGSAPTAEVALSNPGASWHIITSRDVNGDGKADLIWQNDDGTPGVWLMNGTRPIAEAGLTNPGPTWKLVAAGDVNGDGKADLIWQNTDGTLGVWEMNGATPMAEAAIGNPGTNWKVVGTADFNGDSNDDILLQNSVTGNLMIDLMNGTSIASTVSIAVGDPSWHAVSTGEFNGQAEIAWQNNNGTVGLWLMNGTTPVAEAAVSNPGAGWQLVSIDHFTPNGQGDLLFQNTNGAMMLWQMNGTNIAAQTNLLPPGTGWQSVNGHPFATG